MNIYKYDIVFQEVPNEIAIAFYVCGCPLRCPGCHSPELWTEKTGFSLTEPLFKDILKKYRTRATCVLFLGGEWHPKVLQDYLSIARAEGFLTALYTGLDTLPQPLIKHLDFLKTGPWRADLGGLDSPITNQIFMDLRSNTVLNSYFIKEQCHKEVKS